MKENILIDKSIDFGARIVKLHRYLIKTKHEAVLSNQILRSGTSIGANINEAQYGNSKADFIAKLHIALKETAETEYWLHILKKSEFLDEKTADSMLNDCLEIKRILIASINTAKSVHAENSIWATPHKRAARLAHVFSGLTLLHFGQRSAATWASARPTLKMIHRIIFRALRPPPFSFVRPKNPCTIRPPLLCGVAYDNLHCFFSSSRNGNCEQIGKLIISYFSFLSFQS